MAAGVEAADGDLRRQESLLSCIALLGILTLETLGRSWKAYLGRGNTMPLSKDLVAASATPLILSLLRRDDSYGYEIINNVRELSGGQMEWAEGMLYPILHRLDRKGLIEAYWGTSDAGRRRKYYRLLPAGEQHLEAQRKDFNSIQSIFRGLEGGAAHV